MKIIKNLKLYKKALLLYLTMTLTTSALPAFGEGEIVENVNETAITEVEDEQEIVQGTYDDFVNEVNGYAEKLKKMSKKNQRLLSHFNEVYVNLNYQDFADVRKELANDSLIINNNWHSSLTSTYFFAEFAMDYNIDVLDKKKYENAIDISEFIRNEKLKELAHKTFEKFIEVYEAGTIECDAYDELLKLIDELKEKNFVSYYYYYRAMQYLLGHCVIVNYPKNRISKAFKYERSNKLQLSAPAKLLFKIYGDGPEDMFEELVITIFDKYTPNKEDEYEKFYKQMIQEIYTATLVR